MNGSGIVGLAEREPLPVPTVGNGEGGLLNTKKKKKKKKSGASVALEPEMEKTDELKRKEKNIMSEIEAMVSLSKKKRKHSAPLPAQTPSKPLPGRRKVAGTADDPFGTSVKASGVRRTEEGYRIVSEDDVGIKQGGDTPLCPFDCKCCF